LNRLLTRAIDAYSPPVIGGQRFKIFYAFQKPDRPPRFMLFVNDPRLLTPHYQRYIIDKIRAGWGFTGCPVQIELRMRERKIFVKKTALNKGFRKKRASGENFS